MGCSVGVQCHYLHRTKHGLHRGACSARATRPTVRHQYLSHGMYTSGGPGPAARRPYLLPSTCLIGDPVPCSTPSASPIRRVPCQGSSSCSMLYVSLKVEVFNQGLRPCKAPSTPFIGGRSTRRTGSIARRPCLPSAERAFSRELARAKI